MTTESKPPEVKISVDYQTTDRHGRLTKTFYIFDREGGKAKLSQKDAMKMAKAIIKITKEK